MVMDLFFIFIVNLECHIEVVFIFVHFQICITIEVLQIAFLQGNQTVKTTHFYYVRHTKNILSFKITAFLMLRQLIKTCRSGKK